MSPLAFPVAELSLALLRIDPREAVLNVARGHNYVREIGPNRGQVVEVILARVGLPPGAPWCAAFVAYIGWLVYRERWPLKLVGGCVSLYDDARSKGMLRETPEPGSIFLQWGKAGDGITRYRHTGFVWDQQTDGAWRTVEGNTNEAGSPEGVGVFVRTRRFSRLDRFAAWWVPKS